MFIIMIIIFNKSEPQMESKISFENEKYKESFKLLFVE